MQEGQEKQTKKRDLKKVHARRFTTLLSGPECPSTSGTTHGL